jgi:dCMP deaminase
MIIGLTGRNGSGKGEAVRFLQYKSFYPYSLSDVIREEVRMRGMEITRERLIEVGTELRSQGGTAVLAQRILKNLEGDKNYVIDSFRHPDEVQALRVRSDFHLIFIEASPEVRFKRVVDRGREKDATTVEEFLEMEGREAAAADWHGQQLEAVEKIADSTITNNASLGQLQADISELLQHLMRQHERPDWDEYFMKMAKVASLRSNCVKRKVAAVIVRDRRVISTGYNGTPRGTKNCFEGGCPRCNNLADSGTRLEECLCSHGEENAIIQAAYHGVSVNGSMLYSTFAPCLTCTKMIINAGIVEVVYNQDYPLNETSFELFQESGVRFRKILVE